MKTVLIILTACWCASLPAIILTPSKPGPATPQTMVVSVSGFNKGDSIVVNRGGRKVTVTLWGIDAPELDQAGGKEAVANLSRLVGRNNVTVEVISLDRYGRITGKVHAAGTYLNLRMVADGFAWWDRHFAAGAREIQAAEAAARQARRGIWQNAGNIDPFEWRKKTMNQPQPVTQPIPAEQR